MSSPACSRDRVTTMRRPESGRLSNQRRCERNPATAPMTISAGVVGIGERGDRLERAFDRSLRRQRRVVDERRGFVRRRGRASMSASLIA